jgi:hypothetical protein
MLGGGDVANIVPVEPVVDRPRRLWPRPAVTSKGAPPNPALQRTNASVAPLPLAFAAERQYRWADKAMKLIGSLSEQHEREQLVASNLSLRTGDSALARALQAHGVDLATAYILEWIPEQAEDLFVVLTGDRRVVRLEVIRDGGAVVAFDDSPVRAYKPRKRLDRLRVAVALDLLTAPTAAAQPGVAADGRVGRFAPSRVRR